MKVSSRLLVWRWLFSFHSFVHFLYLRVPELRVTASGFQTLNSETHLQNSFFWFYNSCVLYRKVQVVSIYWGEERRVRTAGSRPLKATTIWKCLIHSKEGNTCAVLKEEFSNSNWITTYFTWWNWNFKNSCNSPLSSQATVPTSPLNCNNGLLRMPMSTLIETMQTAEWTFCFLTLLKKTDIFNRADCFLAAMMAIKYGPFQTGSLPILFAKWIFLDCNSAKTACQFISLFSLSIDSEKVGKGEENRVSRRDCWPVLL